MLRKITVLLIALCLTGAQSFSKLSQSTCRGHFLNPITQINWSMIFPIRIAGKRITRGGHSGSIEAPKTVKSAFCSCPSRVLGLPIPGILVSYHQPLFIEEIVKSPGCLSSLGGLSILSGYEKQQANIDLEDDGNTRWQVHWYEYPIFSLLDVFKNFICVDTAQFALIYMTELDPTWQNDEWAAIFAPEAVLFSNKALQTACAIDALAATKGIPRDDFFWCAGSWGPIYPLTGSINASNDRLQSANLAGAKLIARLARMGLLWETVGTSALCKKHPMPIWVKSEFSLDPVYPVTRYGRGVPIGAAELLWEYSPAQTYPRYENINQVIFQEQQCCLRP